MAKLRVTATDDPNPKELTPQNRRDWNMYVDWMEKKGMKGSKELDKGDTGLQWLNKYIQENPTTSLRPEHIKAIQQEVEGIAQKSRDLAQRQGNPNAANVMTGTSKFDGIPGSKTTSFKIPEMDLRTYRNNALVANQKLGLVDSQLRPEAAALMVKQVPLGTKLEKMADGRLYYQDKNGDYQLYK